MGRFQEGSYPKIKIASQKFRENPKTVDKVLSENENNCKVVSKLVKRAYQLLGRWTGLQSWSECLTNCLLECSPLLQRKLSKRQIEAASVVDEFIQVSKDIGNSRNLQSPSCSFLGERELFSVCGSIMDEFDVVLWLISYCLHSTMVSLDIQLTSTRS